MQLIFSILLRFMGRNRFFRLRAYPYALITPIKKPRRVCAAHGANKFQSVFSGGKWVRLQERAARLAKANPCSA